MKKLEMMKAEPYSREAIVLPFQLVMSSLILFFAAGYAWPDDDTAFEVFLQCFRAALKHNDAAALAELTQLPFLYDNHLYGRADFIKAVPVLFDAQVGVCLAVAQPRREDDRYVLNCGSYSFYIGRGQSGDYRLIEFSVDGETI